MQKEETEQEKNHVYSIRNSEGTNCNSCEWPDPFHQLPELGGSFDFYFLKVSDFRQVYYIKADFTEDATIGYTKDYTIMYWSKTAERLLGYTEQEVLGKKVEIIVPENKYDELERIIYKLEHEEAIKSYETIRIHKSGRLIPVKTSVTPLLNQERKFCGVFVQYKDNTDHVNLQKQLESTEELWRNALQGGKFGVWEWRIDNNSLIFHNDWYQILGLDDQWKNDKKFEDWTRLIHKEDFQLLYDILMESMSGKDYVFEFRIRNTSGQLIWVREKGKVTQRDEHGNPLKMVGTIEDITDHRIIREQLAEKCRQLEISKKEAERANHAKTKFLSVISHEIRTPMNGILGSIQLLLKTNLEPKQLKLMNMLKESVDSQMSIINNMLDITRIESGKLDLDPTLFNVKMIANEEYEQLSMLCKPKRLEAKFYFDPEIKHMVIGDKYKIKQILLNLINNSVKFTNHGSISLEVHLLDSDDTTQRIEFRIIDTGIGISQQDKDRIFDNYYQGDLSYIKKHMGTGLGLAISKQLALLMDGDIYVDSILGEGSNFRFECELQKYRKSFKNTEDYEAVDENEPGCQQNIQPMELIDPVIFRDKILLSIEDNEINQEIIEAMVKNFGFHILDAYNGEEALRLLEIYNVDLILMDIQLPEMSGYDLTRHIRNDMRFRDTPIVAMTAFAMEEDRRLCLEAGMDAFITKPIDVDQFYHVCNKLLSEKCKIY